MATVTLLPREAVLDTDGVRGGVVFCTHSDVGVPEPGHPRGHQQEADSKSQSECLVSGSTYAASCRQRRALASSCPSRAATLSEI